MNSRWLCLKAANNHLEGTFTSVTNEAAKAAQVEGEVATSEAAAADPMGNFTAAATEAALEEEQAPEIWIGCRPQSC
jgi:hypothetical protein